MPSQFSNSEIVLLSFKSHDGTCVLRTADTQAEAEGFSSMPISLYFTFRITHYFILFDHTRSFLNPVPHTLKPEPPHSIVSLAYPLKTPQLGPVCFARPFNSTNPRPSARCRSLRAHGPPPLGTPPPNNCSLPRAPPLHLWPLSPRDPLHPTPSASPSPGSLQPPRPPVPGAASRTLLGLG